MCLFLAVMYDIARVANACHIMHSEGGKHRLQTPDRTTNNHTFCHTISPPTRASDNTAASTSTTSNNDCCLVKESTMTLPCQTARVVRKQQQSRLFSALSATLFPRLQRLLPVGTWKTDSTPRPLTSCLRMRYSQTRLAPFGRQLAK